MAGPILSIELAGPPSEGAVAKLGEFLTDISPDRFIVERFGAFDVNLDPERLGITRADRAGSRPFIVTIAGPGFGDEENFVDEHAEGPELGPLIGFTPTHDLAVTAMCNGDVDHRATVLLTVSIMEIVGGVAAIPLLERQVELARRSPGLIALVEEPWGPAYGTIEFARSWIDQPDFRLLK